MGSKYLTAQQARIFGICPYKYYLQYIRKEPISYSQEDILKKLSYASRIVFYAKEQDACAKIEEERDINHVYASLLDMAVAGTISKTSKYIAELDFEYIAKFIANELSRDLNEGMLKCQWHLQCFGMTGKELAIRACYMPDHVGKRIVDFRHKLAGTIPLAHITDHYCIPIQFEVGSATTNGIEKEDIMPLMINALLATEGFGKKVHLSGILYTKPRKIFSIQISPDNKDIVKEHIGLIKECTTFAPTTPHCHRCEYAQVCEYNASCKKLM